MLTTEQIEARFEGIGGSEAASCAGLPDAYYTARELYHIKRREVEPREGDGLLTFLGHEVEGPLARWYMQQTGRKVRAGRTTRAHRDLPWMLAHPDYTVLGVRPKRGLEMKMRAHTDGWGREGTDEIPDPVMLQVQHYMAVTGYQLWDVIVLFRGVEVRIYTVGRDQTLIDRLIDIEGDFWTRVQLGRPPEHDYEHHATNRLIDVLHPQTNGREIELPPEALHWHAVLEDATEKAARYEGVKKAAKAYLKDVMGDAAIGRLPDDAGCYTRKETAQPYYDAGGRQQVSRYVNIRYQRPARTRR